MSIKLSPSSERIEEYSNIRQSESIRSDEGLTLETSALYSFEYCLQHTSIPYEISMALQKLLVTVEARKM